MEPRPSYEKQVTIVQKEKDVYLLSNTYLDVVVTKGAITSLFDKRAERELVPAGQTANQFVLFDDKPLYWQAWDVEVFHLNSRTALSPSEVTSVDDGGCQGSLTTTTRISDRSSVVTTMTLTHDSAQLEFSCTVDWHETQKFLKVEFPTTILSNTSTASYETQYGIVRRPIHYNTSWDMAKFEVCCHKWADLSDASYGVSILNDCKYGFAVVGSTMRLSLLRSPKAPDGHADMGTHNFRYAVLPHVGPLGAETVHKAIEFNNPIIPADNLAHPSEPLFPHTQLKDYQVCHPTPATIEKYMSALRLTPDSDPSIIVDAIKRGEDDEDVRKAQDKREKMTLPVRKGKSVVIRMYDSLGGLSRGFFDFGDLDVKKVCECNLLEDDGDVLKVEEVTVQSIKVKGFKVTLKPFEVKTFRLLLA